MPHPSTGGGSHPYRQAVAAPSADRQVDAVVWRQVLTILRLLCSTRYTLNELLVVIDLEGMFDARPVKRLGQQANEADDLFE